MTTTVPLLVTHRPSLVVSEVFGPTFQGEGPSTGRRCTFLRLGACNLTCAWCDTPYTWDASRYDLRAEMTRRTAVDVAGDVLDQHTGLLVVSGGEPLLQQPQAGWTVVLDAMRDANWQVEVETNGTVTPTLYTTTRVTRFNVSPKLAHSGVAESKRLNPDALDTLVATGKASFKFVATCPTDLLEVQVLADRYRLPPDRIWVMPEGTDSDTVLAGTRTLAAPVLARGWNLTTRLHTLIWEAERGR